MKPTRELYLYSAKGDGTVAKEGERCQHGHSPSAGRPAAKAEVNGITSIISSKLNGNSSMVPVYPAVEGMEEHGKVVVIHFGGKTASGTGEMGVGGSMRKEETTAALETQQNYGLSLSFKTTKNLDQRTNQLYTGFVAALRNGGSNLLEVLFLAVT